MNATSNHVAIPFDASKMAVSATRYFNYWFAGSFQDLLTGSRSVIRSPQCLINPTSNLSSKYIVTCKGQVLHLDVLGYAEVFQLLYLDIALEKNERKSCFYRSILYKNFPVLFYPRSSGINKICGVEAHDKSGCMASKSYDRLQQHQEENYVRPHVENKGSIRYWTRKIITRLSISLILEKSCVDLALCALISW